MQKLVFRCKGCGWEKAIPAQWADISPRYCNNHKCEYSGRVKSRPNSFSKTPEALEIAAPAKEQPKDQEHKAATPTKSDREVKSEYSDKSEDRRDKKKKARGI